MKKRKIISLTMLIFIGGCAHPLVRYDKVSGPNTSGSRVFQFTETVLSFSIPAGGAATGGAPDVTSLSIKAGIIPHDPDRYTITGTSWSDNWGVSTDITATMVGDTTLIKQVGSKITDQRLTAINTAASVAANLIALTAAQSGVKPTPSLTATATPPTGFSFEKFLEVTLPVASTRTDIATGTSQCSTGKRDEAIRCTNLELEGGKYVDGAKSGVYLMDLEIASVPLDSFKVSNFPYESNSLLYSACRTAKITIHNAALGNTWSISTNVVIADPTWYEATAFPGSGSVSTGDGCGASSSADAYAASTPLDYLKTATDAAKTVKDALDKTDSSGAK